jgi:hypothetical protein
MAPEVLKKQPYGVKADVFSFGETFHAATSCALCADPCCVQIADLVCFAAIVLCELILGTSVMRQLLNVAETRVCAGKYPYENEPESTATFEQAIVSVH